MTTETHRIVDDHPSSIKVRGLTEILPGKPVDLYSLSLTTKPINASNLMTVVFISNALKFIVHAKDNELQLWKDVG